MKRLFSAATALLIAAAALAACGGGGGTSPTPTPNQTSQGTGSTASPSPSPTATATATGSGVGTAYTGKVVSTDTGNSAVRDATVTIGNAFTYQTTGYALSNIVATATTAADGTFTITVPAGTAYIQVVASGLISAHRPIQTTPNSWGVAPPANTFGTIGLPTETADDAPELAAINSDRATLATANGKLALTLDADMELSARAVTKNEGTLGYYAHTQPGTNYGWSGHYTCTVLVGAFCGNPIFQNESLGSGPNETSTQMETGNIILGPNDGHYQLVISQTNLFVGLGEYLNGLPNTNTVTSDNYQAQEYLTTTDNPSP